LSDDEHLIDAIAFHNMLLQIAEQVPAAADVQPENVLKPDPALLRHQIMMLEMRIDALEQWAKQMNPTFWEQELRRRSQGN